MSEELVYYVGFSHFLGIGPVKLKALISYFGDIKTAYRANQTEIKKVIGDRIGDRFVDFRRGFNPIKKIDEFKKKGISILHQKHKKYPQPLKHIEDPPICLYVKGDINIFDFSKHYFFAIVGTREPTPYGQQVVRMFSSQLAKAGLVIVSGLALGIDALAHWSAINSNGRTIAVLGCGVDIVYPAVNANLYRKIVDRSGWVISEFPPGHTVLKGLFIARNRIISGLSSGVLVVEGGRDSGSLITVRHAAAQGKEVFAPPSPITSPMSEAPNILLKQGAKLATNIEDILNELGLKIMPKTKKEIEDRLNDDEKIILKIIYHEPKLGDEISLISKKPINEVLNILSLLEIKGIVEKNSQGRYQLLPNL